MLTESLPRLRKTHKYSPFVAAVSVAHWSSHFHSCLSETAQLQRHAIALDFETLRRTPPDDSKFRKMVAIGSSARLTAGRDLSIAATGRDSKRAATAEKKMKKAFRSILHTIPGEVRNAIYDHVFPSLAAAMTPLQDAHKYMPSIALCAVEKAIRSETTGYLSQLRTAWNATTWTINLDDFFQRPNIADRSRLQSLPTLDSVLSGLTDAAAAQIHTLSFTASSFMLPPSEEQRDLTTPFTFTLHRTSTHRIHLSTPLNEQEGLTVNNTVNDEKNHPLHLDPLIPSLMLAIHTRLLEKLYVDAFVTKRGRHAWTVHELGILISLAVREVEELKFRRELGMALQAPVQGVQWL